MFIATNDEGRIIAASRDTILAGGREIEEKDGLTLENAGDWIVSDGGPVYDPLSEEENKPTQEERITALEEELQAAKILLGLEG